MTTIFASQLPTDYGRPATHADHARDLRANPREWGFIAECSSRFNAQQLAMKIRNGHRIAYTPVGEFEAQAISDEKQIHQVWARYVGNA